MAAPTATDHPAIHLAAGVIQYGGPLVEVANPPTATDHPAIHTGVGQLGFGDARVLSLPTATDHPQIHLDTGQSVFTAGVMAETVVFAVPMVASLAMGVPDVLARAAVGVPVALTSRRGTSVVTRSARAEAVSLESDSAESAVVSGPGQGSPVPPATTSVEVFAPPMTATLAFPAPTVATDVTVVAPPMTATMTMPAPSVTGGSGSTIDISPGQSIQGTINANTSGSVYRLLQGTHRLTNGGSTNTTGIRLKPGDEIFGEKDSSGNWLTELLGSVALTNWVQDGAHWRHEGVSQRSFDTGGGSKLPWAPGTAPEFLSVDGEMLFKTSSGKSQAVALAELTADTPFTDPAFGYNYTGKFWLDESSNRIWIAFDPTGRSFEFAYVNQVFAGTAADTTIRDIDIQYFANQAQQGAVRLANAPRVTFTGNRMRNCWSWFTTLGANSYQADNVFTHNGHLCVGTMKSGGVFEYNEVAYGNLQGFNDRWEGGGMKFAQQDNVTIRGNYVHDNHGRGIWPDINNTNWVIEYNYCFHNANGGIVNEINVGNNKNPANQINHIRYNVCIRNSWEFPDWVWGGQIVIQNARGHRIYENYCQSFIDGSDPITLVEQNRTEFNPPYPTENNEIYNNTLVYPSNTGWTGGIRDHSLGTGYAGFNFYDLGVNIFYANDYFLPSGGTNTDRWVWGSLRNWSEWLALGQDVGSTTTTGVPTRSTTLTGTATASITEADIVSGGRVLRLDWDDRTDFWSPRIGSDPVVTQEFIDTGFSGSLGEFAEVAALLTLQDFNRIDHKTLEITFRATASYNIASQEVVTVSPPASACVRSSGLTAGTFTIDAV